MKNNIRRYSLAITCIMWYVLYPNGWINLLFSSGTQHGASFYMCVCHHCTFFSEASVHTSHPKRKFTCLESCDQYAFSLFRLHGEAQHITCPHLAFAHTFNSSFLTITSSAHLLLLLLLPHIRYPLSKNSQTANQRPAWSRSFPVD